MTRTILFSALSVVLLGACGSVESRRVVLAEPEAPAADGTHPKFHLVEEALGKHCATLDCHGQVGRNFRFYWNRGLRLADVPGEGDTTSAEYEATYHSLVALEPFVLDAVVNGTAPPEALTIVRKARGTEHHKGEAQLEVGSDPDTCLVSWLTGAIDTEACQRAAK